MALPASSHISIVDVVARYKALLFFEILFLWVKEADLDVQCTAVILISTKQWCNKAAYDRERERANRPGDNIRRKWKFNWANFWSDQFGWPTIVLKKQLSLQNWKKKCQKTFWTEKVAGQAKTKQRVVRPITGQDGPFIWISLSPFPSGRPSLSLSRPMAASSFLCCRGKISRKKRGEENSWRETEKKNRSRKPECWFIDSWRKLPGYLSSFVILISYNFSNETRKRKDSQSIGPSRKKEKKEIEQNIFFLLNETATVSSALQSAARPDVAR